MDHDIRSAIERLPRCEAATSPLCKRWFALLVKYYANELALVSLYGGAAQHHHLWFSQLRTDDIELGRGKRMIVGYSILDEQYLLTVPKYLEV